MVLLAVDFGEKRVGLAKSDPMGILTQGLGYIENQSEEYVISELQKACSEYQVEKIIFGIPRAMNGEVGIAAQKILQFIEKARREISQEIVEWDERLTTKQASRAFQQAGAKRKKKKEKIDQVAAQLILQNYLDSQRFRKGI